jgi:iron complex outermembrane receptor protein
MSAAMKSYGGGARGSAFIPTSVEREDISGNTGLPPERARQLEAGFKFERPDGLLGATLAFFEITRFDLSESLGVQNPNGNNAFGLIGEARTRGFEAEWQWQPRPYIQVRGGYAHLARREVTAARNAARVGAPLTNAPAHQAHLWTRYNMPEGALRGWGMGVGLTGVSAREAVSTTSPAARLTLPGYVRTDLALYYTRGRTSFAFNLHNALDEAYFASAGSALALIPGEPRNLTFSVRHVW